MATNWEAQWNDEISSNGLHAAITKVTWTEKSYLLMQKLMRLRRIFAMTVVSLSTNAGGVICAIGVHTPRIQGLTA